MLVQAVVLFAELALGIPCVIPVWVGVGLVAKDVQVFLLHCWDNWSRAGNGWQCLEAVWWVV